MAPQRDGRREEAMVAGRIVDPQGTHMRHREAIAYNAKVARELLTEINEAGAGEVTEIVFSGSLTSYWHLMHTRDGVAILSHIIKFPSDADDKWNRRPITRRQKDNLFATVIEGLARMTRLESCGMDMCSQLWSADAVTIHVSYADGTKVGGRLTGAPKEEVRWIESQFDEVFRSVSPHDMDADETFGSLVSLSYAYGGFFGGMHNEAVASRDDDGKCHLSCEETDMLAPASPSGPAVTRHERLLSSDDWDNLIEAVRQADVPHWDAVYEDKGVYDGWWKGLELLFGNGWGIRIRGSNRWDDRCLPIVEFLVAHGVTEKAVGDSVARLRQKARKGDCADEGSVRTGSDDLRQVLATSSHIVVHPDGTVIDDEVTDEGMSDSTRHVGDWEDIMGAIENMRRTLVEDEISPLETGRTE